jgi:DNA polymerase-3 subunit epsilon
MDKYSGAGFSKSGNIGPLFGYASPKLSADTEAPFAVLDFETSGVNPDRGRVLEVAVVTLDVDGERVEEYSTLVNPEDGQVGMSMIHHIVPRMLDDAPTFSEIAGDLVSRLAGKVVVTHNAVFEEKFLAAELKRSGFVAPKFRALDTLQFLPRHLKLNDYKQSTVMRHMGIETDEHTALGDTRGLSRILQEFIQEAKELGYPVPLGENGAATSNAKVSQRVTNLKKGESGWMSNLIPKLPISSFALEDFDRYTYWNLLMDVLADGKITGDEIKQLAILIGKSGLSQSDVAKLNLEFVSQQQAAAEADGVVTKDERDYLAKIAAALGV